MGAPLLIRSARLRLGSPSFGRGRPRAAAGDPGSAVGPFDLGRSRAQNLGWGRSGCYHRPVARSRVRIWLIIFFVPILLMLGGIGYLAWRQSVAAVRVEFSPVPKFIGVRTPIPVDDRTIASLPVTLDFTPPTLEILASTRYLSRGGGGLVALRAKGAARVGVAVGDLFFPGFAAGAPDSGLYATLYALPWNLPPNSPITVSAQDEAGNAVSRALAVDIRPRKFPMDTIDISEQFLASKMPELLPERGQIPPDQLLAAFLTVNRDKRKEAEEMKRKLAQKTKPAPLFEGAFIQPRNTKVFSNFAE